jgi:hypothetical protein
VKEEQPFSHFVADALETWQAEQEKKEQEAKRAALVAKFMAKQKQKSG